MSKNVLTRSKKANALALFQQQRLSEARTLLEEVCRADRDDGEAWTLLGAVNGMLGNYAAAEHSLQHALRLRPSAEAHYYFGNTLVAQNRLDKAVVSFQAALRLQPQLAEAHCNLGDVLQNLGRYSEAEGCYRKAIELRPDLTGAYINLGLALYHQKKLDQVVSYYQKALRLWPGVAEIHYHLGNAYTDLSRFDEAVTNYREAIRLRPDFTLVHNNLALALYRNGRSEEAVAHHREALRHAPSVPGLHTNFGTTLYALGRIEEAEREYRQALEQSNGAGTDPNKAITPQEDVIEWHCSLAAIQLALGRFAQAWPHYAYRPSKRMSSSTPTVLPPDLSGRRLLMVRNQGLGDEIFFLRFISQLKARGAWVAYRPDPRLGSMLSRVVGIDRIAAPDETLEALDFTFSVGDLPLLLGMDDVSKIPAPLPLTALPDRLEAMKRGLAALGSGPYIGVSWRAGTKGEQELYEKRFGKRPFFKETPLKHLAEALVGLPGTVLILQRQPQPGEVEAFREVLGRPAHDLSVVNEDLEDMLALLDLLDDYIGVSNTNMHLRAGLGKTARVLVPHPPEWRWMAEGDESPWFKGFAVYRQGRDQDWDGAFVRLAQDLRRAFPSA